MRREKPDMNTRYDLQRQGFRFSPLSQLVRRMQQNDVRRSPHPLSYIQCISFWANPANRVRLITVTPIRDRIRFKRLETWRKK